MTSPFKQKLRNKIKAINKEDGFKKKLVEYALDDNAAALVGFVLQTGVN